MFCLHHSYLENIWEPLAEALSRKDKKLKVLDICSVSVGKESLVPFSKCVRSGKKGKCSCISVLIPELFHFSFPDEIIQSPTG